MNQRIKSLSDSVQHDAQPRTDADLQSAQAHWTVYTSITLSLCSMTQFSSRSYQALEVASFPSLCDPK